MGKTTNFFRILDSYVYSFWIENKIFESLRKIWVQAKQTPQSIDKSWGLSAQTLI